jgi:D-3-phosphoglycerate dehydrogenase
MTTYTVLIPDKVDPAALEVFEETPAIQVITAPKGMTRDETMAAVGSANAMIIRSSTTVDAEMLQAAPHLKAIARAGVGVDNVDVPLATALGIVVMNTPDGNTIATAEHTFGLMLALARHIPQGHASLRAGKWDRSTYMGVELRGKTLGIIGFGRIGRAIAKRAQAFEMTVIASDPYVDARTAAALGVQMVDLDTLYSRADFITLHSAITEETEGMINAASIARMKPGVRIVNAARGALINDADLAEALRSGHVAGAALDVYAEEPPPPDHPLLGLDNVIDTPHLAASTHDAQVTVAVDAARLIVNALLYGQYDNVVNPAALSS